MPEWVSYPFRPTSRNYCGVEVTVVVDCVLGATTGGGAGVAGVTVVVVDSVVVGVTTGGGGAGVAGVTVVVVDCVVCAGAGVGAGATGGVAGVTVVVVDCVVPCAIAGSESASTTNDPKTTAASILVFIRFSLCFPECGT